MKMITTIKSNEILLRFLLLDREEKEEEEEEGAEASTISKNYLYKFKRINKVTKKKQ